MKKVLMILYFENYQNFLISLGCGFRNKPVPPENGIRKDSQGFRCLSEAASRPGIEVAAQP